MKDKHVIDAIEDLVRASERGDLTIFTSTITRIEVLRGHLSQEAADQFVALFPRSVEWVNVTPGIAQIAHDIRDYYHSANPPKKIKTPDCIHLATAIANAADELNTLDKPDLLSLNERVLDGKYKLKIVRPLLILPPLLQLPPPIPPPPDIAKPEDESTTAPAPTPATTAPVAADGDQASQQPASVVPTGGGDGKNSEPIKAAPPEEEAPPPTETAEATPPAEPKAPAPTSKL